MNELFRNFVSSSVSTNSFNSEQRQSPTNPFIGEIVDIKDEYHLRLEELVAEGGFGYVFRAKDLKTSKIYALKRLIAADNESKEEIENEISMLNRVQSHKHIMKFFCFDRVKPNVCYLLCEFCGSGSLKDFSFPIVNLQFLTRTVYQVCLALEKIHLLSIIHRDIKVENILFDDNGFVKLCDFGSATDKFYKIDHNWTPIQRSLLEDDMNRHTTPMYRPPEILDTYLHYEINTAMDIWAFGCLLFFLRFGQHPFEDSSKLRIINCNFTIPNTANQSDIFVQIIKDCLKVNPADRIQALDIIKKIENNFVELNSPCVTPKSNDTAPVVSTQSIINSTQPSVPNINSIGVPGVAHSYISGFTRYLKNTSNKVMQTVQNSIARQDLDLTFLTSRLIVMSYPAEGLESAYRNHVEDVRIFLDSRGSPYTIVNVSGRSYDSNSKFGLRVSVLDAGVSWKETRNAPSLHSIIFLCDHLFKWFNENKLNTAVIHCMDGKTNSALLTASFLLMISLFRNPHQAIEFFNNKRPLNESLTPSQFRSLEYVTKLKQQSEKYLNFFSCTKQVLLKSIKMNGVPLFTKLRDGCRPFIELFSDSRSTKIFSTYTDYEKLIHYPKEYNNSIVWNSSKDTSFELTSSLCLVISHARLSIGSKMLNQNRMTAIRIASMQFCLFFEANNCDQKGSQKVVFSLSNMDGIDELERYPFNFNVEIEFEIKQQSFPTDSNHLSISQISQIGQNEVILINKPDCIFGDSLEFEEFINFNSLANQQQKENLLTTNCEYSTSDDDSCSSESINNFQKFEIAENHFDHGYSSQTKKHYIQSEKKNDAELLLNLSFGDSNKNDSTSDKNFAALSSDIELISAGLRSSTNLVTDDLLGLDDSMPNEKPLFASTFDDQNSLKPTVLLTSNQQNNQNINSHHLSSKPVNSKSNLSNNTSFDPFGDLNNFLGNFPNKSGNNKQQSKSSNIPLESSNQAFSSNNSSNSNFSQKTDSNKAQSTKRPDYSRLNFEDCAVPKTGITSPRMVGNEFEDLLQGFKKTQPDNINSNKSIAQLRKEELVKGGADPTRLKINDWTENKEKNIRALLCSLNKIVWEGCNWTTIGMHQLLTPNDVKKMYRKACLAVHPDKLMGSPHEELAKYIFMELNDAWTEFEKTQR